MGIGVARAQVVSGGVVVNGGVQGNLTVGTGAFGDTTLSTITGNNTSACGGNPLPVHCVAAQTILKTAPNNITGGAQTVNVDPLPGNMSSVNVHTIPYPGFNGRVWFWEQPWFCMTGTATQILPDGVVQQICNNHQKVGYDSSNSLTIAAQINHRIRVGGNSSSLDWYGTSATQAFIHTTTLNWKAYLAADNPKALDGTPYTMSITVDKGAIQNGTASLSGCPAGNQTSCLISVGNALFDDVRDLFAEPGGTVPAWYESIGGNPVVPVFIDETYWAGSDWAAVRAAWAAHVALYAHPFILIKNYDGATFLPSGYAGAFVWHSPPTWSATKQFWYGDSNRLAPPPNLYFQNFYDACIANPTAICVGGAGKGFDDNNAMWSVNRVRAQQCGQCITKQAAETGHNGDFSAAHQLPYFGLMGTDYEEGTEMETGIDNCYTLTVPANTGDLLPWTLVASDSVYASPSTIDHFRILYGPQDGSGQLKIALDNIPNTATSQNLATIIPFGTWNVYVQMIGDALIMNRTSNASTYTNPTSACGAPTYLCTRTDFAYVPVPTPPNMGNLVGAGTSANDPDFGTKIVRITDSTTSSSTLVVDGGGSGDKSVFNTDSTLITVDHPQSNVTYPMNFDPVTMLASRMYTNWTLTGDTQWSQINANKLYLAPTTPGSTYKVYDVTDRVNGPPTPTTIVDFKTGPSCLGHASFTPNTVTWVSNGGVGGNDTVFAAAFSNNGAQGTGNGAKFVVVYTVGSGCRMLNLGTGAVTGDWGPVGNIPSWTSITSPSGFQFHNVKLSKGGDWIVLQPTVGTGSVCFGFPCATSTYFWQIGTLTVTQVNPTSGHWTEGYSHWINHNNSPIGQQRIRLYATPSISNTIIPTPFPPNITAPFDVHQGWANADANDTYPFFQTVVRPPDGIYPVNAAWYGEIQGISPVTGTVYRFAHHFSTFKSLRFSTQQAIGSVSQDGRFYAFSSDWMGTLGSEGGSASCTLGGPNLGTGCMGAVFVLNLVGGGLTYYADATNGLDTNPGTFAQPVQTVTALKALVRGKTGAMAVLRGGTYPLTLDVSCGAGLCLDAGDSGVTWKGFAGEKVIFSGATILPHSFTNTGGITCGGSCSQWQLSYTGGATPTYANFSQMWYQPAGQTEPTRRFRPTLSTETNGYSTQGANNAPAYECKTTASASAPSNNQANCAAGQFEAADRLKRDATGGHADTQTAFHGVTGSVTIDGAITGVHEVEAVIFENWTANRMRLTPTGGDATNPCTLGTTRLCFTGKWTLGAVFGAQSGNRYLLDNVFEQLGTARQFYNDRCTSNCPSGLDATWTLNYLAAAGENPNNDTLIIPQLNKLISATGLQNTKFQNITFSYNNYVVPDIGQKTTSHGTNFTAAISCNQCSNVTFDQDRFAHLSTWALEFIGTAQLGVGNIVSNSVCFDVGVGCFRSGQIPNGADTDANVAQYNTFQNNTVRGVQRFFPGGIGLSVWIGNSHHNQVLNNTLDDSYSGAIGVGATLNSVTGQGVAFSHDNIVKFNLCMNVGQGVTDDQGCLHAATLDMTGNIFSNNIVHDVNCNTMSFGHYCFAVYLDGGSRNWTITNNLMYRLSTSCFFFNNYGAGGSPSGGNHTVANNICAYGKKGGIQKSQDTPNKVADLQHNIFYWDIGNPVGGIQVDMAQSVWQPKPGGTILDIATFNFNTYFNTVADITGLSRAFYTTDGNPGFNPSCNGVGTGCTTAQWQALGEDVNSTFNTNPGFVGPSFTQGDNYNFLGGMPGGFNPIDYTVIGAQGTLPSIPAIVAPGFPLQLLDKNTDY